jgi:hypothetical protein
MSGPDPAQPYTPRYNAGFDTDRELFEPNFRVWDFLFKAVEKFVCRNPYVASHEVADSGGVRFLMTEEAGFADCPPMAVYFKPDDATRRVVFLTVERLSDGVPLGDL